MKEIKRPMRSKPRRKKNVPVMGSILIMLLCISICFACFIPSTATVYRSSELEIPYKEPLEKPLPPLSDKHIIAKKIIETFPEQPRTMLAVAIQESSLNPNAVSHNCYYKGYWTKTSKKPVITDPTPHKTRQKGDISWFCKKGDEAFAWSKDGGIFQINTTEDVELSVDENIALARKKFDTQGKSAWSSYNSGDWKKHLAKADKLIAELSTSE